MSLRKKFHCFTLVEIAEVVLKNNIFTFKEKPSKQKLGAAIGTKFAPPYSILFIAELEDEISSEIELKPYPWWRYIDNIIFLWGHGEEKLKEFIEHLNEKHLNKIHGRMVSDIDQLLGCYSFTYRWTSCYSFICQTYRYPSMSPLFFMSPMSLQIRAFL